MKYISFFHNQNFYYCYSYDDNKIYRGMNAEKFVPNIKYFLSITLTLFFGGILNSYFQDKLNDILCIALILLSIIIGSVIGFIVFNKIERKSVTELKEAFSLKEQLQDYIVKGKKQFLIQIVILLSVFISSFLFYAVFFYSKNIIIGFLATVLCFAFTLAILWIKPIQKFKFFKSNNIS